MTDTLPSNTFTSTHPVVSAYTHVLEPSQYEDPVTKKKGKLEYSAQLVFAPDDTDFAQLKSLCINACKEKWGYTIEQIREKVKARELRMPWFMGDAKIEKSKAKAAAKNKTYNGNLDFMAGKVIVKVHTEKFPPQVGFFANGGVTDLLTDEAKKMHKGKFYSGVEAYVQAKVDAYNAVGDDGKPGVTLYLQNFTSNGKGKQLGGKTSSQVFGGYAGKASAEDPTQGAGDPDGLDDKIPF